VTAALRVFLIGGLISYRALFNWARPAIYIPTMLGSPLFQILFFAYLGRYSGVRDDGWFVVGNALQACGMAGIYGMTLTIANERQYQTLSPLLATPANRLALFLGRAVPQIANGLLVSTFGFVVGLVFLRFSPAASSLPALALCGLSAVLSCTAFGMLLGSIGLRARDVFFISNIVYFLMLLLCGVNVPLSALPSWMRELSQALPLTHGIEAARAIAGGAALGDVSGLVLRELAVGLAYAAAAFAVFRALEVLGRRSGALDAF
jgi:ABC-2 type transport system permease protein